MFERFTDQAKRSVMLAEDAARDLAHAYVGTEHLLLGLLANDRGVAHRALDLFDVTTARARAEVDARVGPAAHGPGAQLPFTSSAKGALERSQWEARQLRADRIGTQHLLLGLLRPGDTSAAEVLEALEVTPDLLRQAVLQLVEAGAEDAPAVPEEAARPDEPTDGVPIGAADGSGSSPPPPQPPDPSARRAVSDDLTGRPITPGDIAAELRRLAEEVAALRGEVARLTELIEPRGGWRRR